MAGQNYRMIYKTRQVEPGNAWLAPAGVSQISISIMSGSTELSCTKLVTVVPNTTYAITINNAAYTINNANTFGSVFVWTGSGTIKLSWVE